MEDQPPRKGDHEAVKTPVKDRKGRGRSKTTGPGVLCTLRLHQPLLGDIDEWRASQAVPPTRAQAVIYLAAVGVAALKEGSPAGLGAKPSRPATAAKAAPKKTRRHQNKAARKRSLDAWLRVL